MALRRGLGGDQGAESVSEMERMDVGSSWGKRRKAGGERKNARVARWAAKKSKLRQGTALLGHGAGGLGRYLVRRAVILTHANHVKDKRLVEIKRRF